MSRWSNWYHISFYVLATISSCTCWTAEELSLYDLVEEAQLNFYEFFGIPQDASTQEIKRAYRRLSLEWHPDRNKEEGATEKFRQVASIYEVLKDSERREKYNFILENGMPDWRSGIYYYRRYRKMSGLEAALVLIIFLSGGHYLMLWGSFFEKYLIETQRRVKARKGEKKKQAEAEEAQRVKEVMDEHRPTFWQTLPVKMVKFSYSLIIAGISNIRSNLEKPEPIVEPVKHHSPIRRVAASQPERPAQVANIQAVLPDAPHLAVVEEQTQKGGRRSSVWTKEEMASLVKLSTTKFPPGCAQRWTQVARVLGRTVEDVTAAAKKLKDWQEDLVSQQSIVVEQKNGDWSQEEQKKLEAALVKYPKSTEERWDRITEELSGRTKAEVIERFKQLASIVKAKKGS